MINFQHLKDSRESKETPFGGPLKEETQGKIDLLHKPDQSDQPITTSKNARIIETEYCRGCIRSCVDMIGTPYAAWYCMRDPKGAGRYVEFVRIKKETIVSQCKYRMEEY